MVPKYFLAFVCLIYVLHQSITATTVEENIYLWSIFKLSKIRDSEFDDCFVNASTVQCHQCVNSTSTSLSSAFTF